jgi:hypothetical protein
MKGINTPSLNLLFDPRVTFMDEGKELTVKNKSETAALAGLNAQINTLAREIGELDPDDPKRAELVKDIYRLTELARHSRETALSASIASSCRARKGTIRNA